MFVALVTSVALSAAGLMQPAPESNAYRQGVLAREAGHPAAAVRLLEQWLGERPNDADARLHYGYALLDLGRTADAEAAFRRVLAQAPDYADARIGLARVEQRRGKPGRALAWLDPLPADNADAGAVRAQLAKPVSPRWSLDVGAAVTAVGRRQPDWREASGQFSYRFSEQASLSGRIEDSRRFGMHDTYGEGQVVRRFSTALSAYLLAGGTPHADYRPRWQIGGGISALIRAGADATVLAFDLREARYGAGRIATLQPSIEQHVLGGKAWVTGRTIILIDGRQVHVGALGRIDLQASPTLRVFAGAADSPDTSAGVVTRVTSLFGGIEAALGPRQLLRLSLAQTNQQVGASRTEFALGAGLRF